MTQQVQEFLDLIQGIHWFENSGKPTEEFYLLHSIFEAVDVWGQKMMAVWSPQTIALEQLAEEKIGAQEIDSIFLAVAQVIDQRISQDWAEFIERTGLEQECGLEPELFDSVKRDIAWACVEAQLQCAGFFTQLFLIYQRGYFPCSWFGEFPEGKAVVL